MKDIVIKSRDIRRELIVWACCIVALTVWNAYAVATRGTSWNELYSLWYVILPLSVLLYVLLAPVRWLVRVTWRGIRPLTCRRSRTGAKA